MSYRDSVIGQQMIERLLPFNANTDAQIRVRAAFDRASSGYSLLSTSSKAKWKAFGLLDKRRDLVTGRLYSLTGRQAFMGLGAKYALAMPGNPLPLNPPAVKFAGDLIGVTCSASTGKLVYKSSGANSDDVITELLVQKLASADREPALYATAYRFVSNQSGEERGIVPIGIVTVALSVEDGGTVEAAKPARTKKAA